MAFSFRFRKNKRIISQSCARCIHHWESYSSTNPCEDVLLRHINRYMDENRDLISAQRETDADFEIFILKLIAKVSFDMIVSRAFTGEGSLKFVHNKAMEELLYPGYISQREFDEDKIAMKSITDERVPQIYKDLMKTKEKLIMSYSKKRSLFSILLICMVLMLVGVAQAKPFTTRKGITFGMDYESVCAEEAKQKLTPKEGTKTKAIFEENVKYGNVPVTLTYEFVDEKMSQIIYTADGGGKEYKSIQGQATKELGKPVQLESNGIPAFTTPLYAESSTTKMIEYSHWHSVYDDYDVIADLWLTDDNQITLAISYADQALTHPALKSGATGAGVKIIQEYLIQYGYLNGEVTGVFDKATTKALKDFQYNNNLKETGICDGETWEDFEGRPVRQQIVYKSKNGKVYHSKSNCSGMKTATEMTLTEALKKGLRPCSHCH